MGRKGRHNETEIGRYITDWIERHYEGNLESAAYAAGLSVTTLRSWMRGAIGEPSVVNLKRLADTLKCPFEDLCRAAVELPPLYPRDNPELAAELRHMVEYFSRLSVAELQTLVRVWEEQIAAQRRNGHQAAQPILNGQ